MVCLVIAHVLLLQKRIPVDRSKPYLFRLVVDRGNDDSICVRSLLQLPISGVAAEECYRRVSFLLFHALIKLKVLLVDCYRLQLIKLHHCVCHA